MEVQPNSTNVYLPGITIGDLDPSLGQCPRNSSVTLQNFMILCTKNPGMLIELVALYFEMSHVSLNSVWLVPLEIDVGIMKNGSWSGLVKLIMNGDINISLPYLTPTPQRMKAIDFTSSAMKIPVGFITRKPPILGVQHFHPFGHINENIWLAFLPMGLLLAIALSLHRILHVRSLDSCASFQLFLRDLIDCYCLFTGNSAVTEASRHGKFWNRVIVALWSMLALIIAGLYSGSILIGLVRQEFKLPFTNIESLATCILLEKCIVLVGGGGIRYLQLTSSVNVPSEMVIIQNALRKTGNLVTFRGERPPKKYWEKFTSPRSTDEPIYTWFSNTFNAQKELSNNYNTMRAKHEEVSNYFFMPAKIVEDWTIGIRKNSTLKNRLSRALMNANLNGLSEAVKRKYFISFINSLDTNFLSLTPKALTMQWLKPTAFALICGCFVALTTFLLETLFPNIHGFCFGTNAEVYHIRKHFRRSHQVASIMSTMGDVKVTVATSDIKASRKDRIMECLSCIDSLLNADALETYHQTAESGEEIESWNIYDA